MPSHGNLHFLDASPGFADTPSRNPPTAEDVWAGSPFVRSSALAAGVVTESELSKGFVRLAPRIYVAKWAAKNAHVRVRAAAMWAPEGAVIAGAAAALLHGERWLSSEAVAKSVDLYVPGARRIPGLVRNRRIRTVLPAAHVTSIRGILCTTVARTAVDCARWTGSDEQAIVAVDSLCNASGTDTTSVAEFARDLRGIHGMSRVRDLLLRCDHRADSPPETRFRLLIADSPLPDPEPQVRIVNHFGIHIATADLAYRAAKVALFYDGGDHLKREQRDFDSDVTAALGENGWRSMRVTAGMLRSPSQRETLLRRIGGLLTQQGAPAVGQ